MYLLNLIDRVFFNSKVGFTNQNHDECIENNIVNFEELMDVRYNKVLSKLEATLLLHETAGFRGNICSGGSTEYIRFFVDTGSGFENAGFTSVQVYDHVERSPINRPQKYLIQLYTEKGRFFDKHTPVKIRATLSWNELPPTNPDWSPVFGNCCESLVMVHDIEQITDDVFDVWEMSKPLQFAHSY